MSRLRVYKTQSLHTGRHNPTPSFPTECQTGSVCCLTGLMTPSSMLQTLLLGFRDENDVKWVKKEAFPVFYNFFDLRHIVLRQAAGKQIT